MPVARITLNEIYAPIEKDLKDFTEALKGELKSKDPLISDIHDHLLKMSGKFLRPALLILSSKTGTQENPKAIRLAVAVELIHTATLVHDDIIDNSDFRRNQPSVPSKWGREISIVAGDYLYAKAFLLLAGIKDIWVSEAFAACAHIMCEGEMKQIEKRHDRFLSESEYLKIIHKKTAALFQAACAGGAYFAGSPLSEIEKLGDYGFQLGMAFQIVDDCLDLVGESESLGKTVGLDIYKNDMTLPILYLLQDLNPSERDALLSEMRTQSEGDLFNRVRKLAIEKKSVEKAMDKARLYIDQAVQDLQVLRPSVYKDSLLHLAQYCLDRIR